MSRILTSSLYYLFSPHTPRSSRPISPNAPAPRSSAVQQAALVARFWDQHAFVLERIEQTNEIMCVCAHGPCMSPPLHCCVSTVSVLPVIPGHAKLTASFLSTSLPPPRLYQCTADEQHRPGGDHSLRPAEEEAPRGNAERL